MALNSDQLIQKFLKLRYWIDPQCTCKIEIQKMLALRQGRDKKMKEQMKEFPEEAKREMINRMIEKEKQLNAISKEDRG
jgi:hypothetical protein